MLMTLTIAFFGGRSGRPTGSIVGSLRSITISMKNSSALSFGGRYLSKTLLV